MEYLLKTSLQSFSQMLLSIILGHRMIKPKIVQNAIEGWYLFLSLGGIRCHTSLFLVYDNATEI